MLIATSTYVLFVRWPELDGAAFDVTVPENVLTLMTVVAVVPAETVVIRSALKFSAAIKSTYNTIVFIDRSPYQCMEHLESYLRGLSHENDWKFDINEIGYVVNVTAYKKAGRLEDVLVLFGVAAENFTGDVSGPIHAALSDETEEFRRRVISLQTRLQSLMMEAKNLWTRTFPRWEGLIKSLKNLVNPISRQENRPLR